MTCFRKQRTTLREHVTVPREQRGHHNLARHLTPGMTAIVPDAHDCHPTEPALCPCSNASDPRAAESL